MSDFFDNKQEEVQTEVQQEVKEPEKIKVGEKEYTQDELASIVGLGELGREMETKYNTKIDRVWPEFTKTTQELKTLREEKAKSEAERINQKVNDGQQLSEEEAIRQAKEQARKIGIPLNEEVEEKITRKVMEVLEAKDLLNTCRTFEEDLDGKDGRPAFKTQDILKHMDETGIKNPEKAYKDKYEEQLDKWKEDKIKSAKPKGMPTEEGGSGAKSPADVKVDKTNFDGMVREALSGGL